MALTTYTITAYDAEAGIIDVTFGDGSWSRLKLSQPMPQNAEQLTGWIRRFLPFDLPAGFNVAPTDLSYINELVGQTIPVDTTTLTVAKTPVLRSARVAPSITIGTVDL